VIDPAHPDNQHHAWSNYCLYCHTDDYDPAALHELRLWHYCVNCVLVCRECSHFKPLYSFAFNIESESYKLWKASQKTGEWRLVNPTSSMNRAPKSAHDDICNHCNSRHIEERERTIREQATKKKQVIIDKQNQMLASAQSQAALAAILDEL
jgi:hypothetical protein